ncbi:MAG: DUF1080 domain-containing protein [Chitinophagaceae bacterium]
MYKIALTIAVATMIMACGGTKNDDGFLPMFDGKTTNGWHTYNADTIGTNWKIEDGALHLDANKKAGWQSAAGGDIVYDSVYDNFHFKTDWKIADSGNSGIIMFVQEDKKIPYVWHTGMEMQVLDNDGHPDAKIPKHRAGDLYDLIASSSEPVKRGEWNHAEIISNQGKLELKLNGVTVVTTTMWDDNWKKLIAGSKFKDMPGFGTFKSGKIALQDHGNNVWYKNIMIKRL